MSSSRATADNENEDEANFFPEGFQPSDWDVICQRGRENYEHGEDHYGWCVEILVS
jgi:hypothetical protein